MPAPPDPAVTVDPELLARARREAKRRGVSVPDLFRISLDALLEDDRDRADQPWMELAGSIEQDDPDASGSVDTVARWSRVWP